MASMGLFCYNNPMPLDAPPPGPRPEAEGPRRPQDARRPEQQRKPEFEIGHTYSLNRERAGKAQESFTKQGDSSRAYQNSAQVAHDFMAGMRPDVQNYQKSRNAFAQPQHRSSMDSFTGSQDQVIAFGPARRAPVGQTGAPLSGPGTTGGGLPRNLPAGGVPTVLNNATFTPQPGEQVFLAPGVNNPPRPANAHMNNPAFRAALMEEAQVYAKSGADRRLPGNEAGPRQNTQTEALRQGFVKTLARFQMERTASGQLMQKTILASFNDPATTNAQRQMMMQNLQSINDARAPEVATIVQMQYLRNNQQTLTLLDRVSVINRASLFSSPASIDTAPGLNPAQRQSLRTFVTALSPAERTLYANNADGIAAFMRVMNA